jgi:hypothetical protein
MNLHPTEKRALLEDEEIIESWPSSMPYSPICIRTNREFRGIGILWIVVSWGAGSLQIFWPRFLRLILHRGFILVLYDDLFFNLDHNGFEWGFFKPIITWRRVDPFHR